MTEEREVGIARGPGYDGDKADGESQVSKMIRYNAVVSGITNLFEFEKDKVRILEFGAGEGLFADAVYDAVDNSEVFLYDPAYAEYEALRERVIQRFPIITQAELTALPDKTFDLVTMVGVIQDFKSQGHLCRELAVASRHTNHIVGCVRTRRSKLTPELTPQGNTEYLFRPLIQDFMEACMLLDPINMGLWTVDDPHLRDNWVFALETKNEKTADSGG